MPRRYDALFAQIASFPALYAAAEGAARGKRRKPGVTGFLARIEPELLALERGFTRDSDANRVGAGTHAAVARSVRFRDRHAGVLRCDIYRDFPADPIPPDCPEACCVLAFPRLRCAALVRIEEDS